jgi:hypothetical protein
MTQHPIGPDVAAGSGVLVLARAGNKPLPPEPYGQVLPPGYSYALAMTKAEPAMRVIAVRLIPSGQIVDATAWELVVRGADVEMRERRIAMDMVAHEAGGEGMSEPRWCAIHQHFKWCEHNGGCNCSYPLEPTGWHEPPDGDDPASLAHEFAINAHLIDQEVVDNADETERALAQMISGSNYDDLLGKLQGFEIPVSLKIGFIEGELGTINSAPHWVGNDVLRAVAHLLEETARQIRSGIDSR